MIMKRVLSLIAALALFFTAAAQEIRKSTHLYAVKDGQELYLDRYTSSDVSDAKRPCVIFVFGGGFSTGLRDAAKYLQYYDYLARKGYDVVAIDYRLGMKGVTDPGIFSAISQFKATVNMAVEDLYSATGFVLEHAAEWGIDTSRMVASGSSAGAITVLQAENGICNGSEASKSLPAGFNYAGIISFAGAIFSTDGKPEWHKAPAPIMFFHGTSDKNVPYDKARVFGIGFYGSGLIASQLRQMRTPYYFYSVEYEDHSLAETPMTDNLEQIGEFLDNYVEGGLKQITEVHIENLNAPIRPTDFSIFDYLGSNYGE